MTKNHKIALATFLYFAFISGLIWHSYPKLIEEFIHPAPKLDVYKPSFSIALQPNTNFSSSPATSIFRENIERTGINRNETLPLKLQKSWTFKTLNVGIHTASKSSPAIDETGIYVGADNSWFYSFDHDGKLRWKFFISGSSRGIHGTATLDQDHVYFGGYNGTLYCLDKKTGSLVWLSRLGIALGASPVLYGDSIYAGVELAAPANGFLASLRRRDGKIEWKTELLGEQTHSSPTIDTKNSSIFIAANNGIFYAFDLKTGGKKWSSVLGRDIKTTSPLVDGVLYVASWAKTLTALNALTGETVWQSKLEYRVRSSPSYIPDLGYLIFSDEDGKIYSIDHKTGKIVWTIQSDDDNSLSSALIIKNEHGKYVAWLPCKKNTLCALDPRDGTVLSSYALENALTSVPVVWKGSLYLALDKTGGLVKWESATHGHSSQAVPEKKPSDSEDEDNVQGSD